MRSLKVKSLIAVGLAGIGAGALVVAGLNYRTANSSTAALAESNARLQQATERVTRLDTDMGVAIKRADAIEADNAELVTALAQARLASAPAARPSAKPLSLAEFAARLKQAESLVDGDPEAALRELLWCYDEGLPQLVGTARRAQLNAVAHALGKLAKRYPAAGIAARERLEKASRRILSSADDSEAVSELASLAQAIGDEHALVSVYDQIPPGDPRRKGVAIYAFSHFVATGRYSDAVLGRPYASMSSMFERLSKERPLPPNVRDPEGMKRAQRDYAVKTAVTNIEVLAGAGDLEHARILAGRLLASDNSSETHALLQSRLVRAGHADLLK